MREAESECVSVGMGDAATDVRSDLSKTVYQELRAIAHARLRSQRSGHTLQATALVNEAWLKLRQHFDGARPTSDFFKAAAHSMRQILIDHARGKHTAKRGGGMDRAAIEPGELAEAATISPEANPDELLALDDALRALEAWDASAAQVVTLRFFGGLSVEETAAALNISERTVKREWQFARNWLRERMSTVHA